MNARVNLYLAMAWAVCVSLSTVAAVSNYVTGATVAAGLWAATALIQVGLAVWNYRRYRQGAR